jgi:hypothetical protein
MTGNVAQVFLTDDEWSATLQAIGTALRSEGYLVFETRRPERRAWEEWAADTGRQLRDVPGVGRVEERRLMILMPTFSYRPTSASRSTSGLGAGLDLAAHDGQALGFADAQFVHPSGELAGGADGRAARTRRGAGHKRALPPAGLDETR